MIVKQSLIISIIAQPQPLEEEKNKSMSDLILIAVAVLLAGFSLAVLQMHGSTCKLLVYLVVY